MKVIKRDFKDLNVRIILFKMDKLMKNLRGRDLERFIMNIYQQQVEKEGGKVISMLSEGKGHPDFIIEYKDKTKRYVEIKSEKDSMRFSQWKWILNNPDKRTILLFPCYKENLWEMTKE